MIARIAAEPRYRHRNGLGRSPRAVSESPPISGDISVPVLSTQTLCELFGPFHLRQIYALRVAEHGVSAVLSRG